MKPNAATQSGLRFSLISLFVALALISSSLVLFQLLALREFYWARTETHMVPVRGPEVAATIDDWLRGHGFQPIEDAPQAVQATDFFGQPFTNFYVGSYQGSRPFYVSVDPNWDAVDRGIYADASNVLIYVAADWRVPSWQRGQLTELLYRFLDEFHQCCDTLGPFPPS